ncbi:peptidase [Fulvivirga sp. RKSG066]|uniref:alpha/beta hydrolase family protein n=1 Tax=Fulvivirga aurantia TaxID=2529383 RepID=UPI0012BD8090|nr:prolyl oligopeptidase family serine peptidase [Fulvivirga aurantia]MTI20294.1 peptidase [Fulvivirga aurantia]
MKTVKQIGKIVLGLVIIAGLFIGFKVGYAYYSSYQDLKSLDNTVLAAELTASEIARGESLTDGEILYKRPIDLSTIEPLWKKIADNDTLKANFKYLDALNFFSVVYKSDSLLVNGIFAEPKEDGEFPVIIFNRGGNKKVGKESRMSTLFSLILSSSAQVAKEGYVILAPCYRENDKFGGRDINDVLNLIKTAEYLPKANVARLGMMGWSRGGMMTYLSLKRPGLIKTAVVVNGPTDLQPLLTERPEMEMVCHQLIPNYSENKEEELQKRSVVYWTEELDKNASLLILCGTEDEQVNPNQAHKIADRLAAIEYDYTLREFKTDHKFTGKSEELSKLLIDWFDTTL